MQTQEVFEYTGIKIKDVSALSLRERKTLENILLVF